MIAVGREFFAKVMQFLQAQRAGDQAGMQRVEADIANSCFAR